MRFCNSTEFGDVRRVSTPRTSPNLETSPAIPKEPNQNLDMYRKYLHTLLPEYVNHTLDPIRRRIVAWWLKRDTAAQAEFHALTHLRAAIHTQPLLEPPPHLYLRLQGKLQTQTSTPLPSKGVIWQAWAGGMVLVFLSLILIWNVLPPGIILQWTAQGGEPVATVTAISARPHACVSAAPGAGVYTFRDLLLFPGQEYVYRVEVIDQNGLSSSQTIMSDALQALPGQLALLLSLIIAGYGIHLALQKPSILPVQLV